MATSSADQPNNGNLKPDKGKNNQQAVVDGDGPPKTEKQLAKEAEKAEKLKKYQEKQKAIAITEKQVILIKLYKILFNIYFSRKKRKQKVV